MKKLFRRALRSGSFGGWQAFAGALKQLPRKADGAVAVEFALIAVPFFALLFVILNSALLMFYNAVIQGAVTTAARQIETGQFQNTDTNCPPSPNANLTTFENSVCANTFGQTPCSQLTYDVRAFSTYSAINIPPPSPTTKYCFNTGGSSSIVAVRVLYNWSNMIPGLSALMGTGNSATQLQYTVIVKNEPF